MVLNGVRELDYLLSNGTSNTNHRPAFRDMAEQRSGENRVWVVIIIAKAIEGPLAGAGRKERKSSDRELMVELAAGGGAKLGWRADVGVAPAGVHKEDLCVGSCNSDLVRDRCDSEPHKLSSFFWPAALRRSIGRK